MSLFNFQNDFNHYNDHNVCNCETCSEILTEKLVKDYVDMMLQAKNEEELVEIAYDLVNMAKIYGIREYLHDTIVAKNVLLKELNKVNVEHDEDDFYGANGNWFNRL